MSYEDQARHWGHMEPRPRSLRCDYCDINWPRGYAFLTCYGCGEATSVSTDQPLDSGPAADLVLHFKKRDEQRTKLNAIRDKKHRKFEEHYLRRALAELERDIQAWNRGHPMPN